MKCFTFLTALLATSVLCYASCNDSGVLPVSVPDTTSHQLTWEVTTLGDGASSILYDVAFINDTLAYAVGEIYLRDSIGNWDPDAFNAAKWTGSSWVLIRIPFVGACSAVRYPALRAVWAFSKDNILVTNGGSFVRYDGREATMDCRMNSLLVGAINKIFSVAPGDVYAVGNSGTIVHFVNDSWEKLESGTTLDLHDAWGFLNTRSGMTEVLAVASNPYSSLDRRILHISGTTVTTISDNGIQEPLSGVWFTPGKQYYVVGSGIYQKSSLSDQRWRNGPRDITTFYAEAIRGNALNDVYVAGDFGELLHFNGSTWKSYREQTGLQSGLFHAIALEGSQVVAVGENNSRAIIALGRRVK